MALECTAKQMIDMLDEHLPYEVAMMLVARDGLYPTLKVEGVLLNAMIETFCLHARNLFEFLTRKDGGGKNYAYAKAYVPTFNAFQNPPSQRRQGRPLQEDFRSDYSPQLQPRQGRGQSSA
jgi:hypothetical protein